GEPARVPAGVPTGRAAVGRSGRTRSGREHQHGRDPESRPVRRHGPPSRCRSWRGRPERQAGPRMSAGRGACGHPNHGGRPAGAAARYVTGPKKASDPAQQPAAAEWAAKLLKVDKIEWTGQMLLAISAGTNTAPHEVRLVSLRVNQGVLTVTWDLDPKTGTG